MDAALVFVVVAAVVLLAALVVYLLPALRPGGADAGPSAAGPGSGGTASRSASPGAPLVHGFSYLQVNTGPGGRRGGVQTRLERAFRRVDAVDPHVTSRRIGEALLSPGASAPPGAATASPPPATASPFGNPAPPTPPGQPAVLWVDPPQDRGEELR